MKILKTSMFEVPLYHIKIDNWKEKKKLLLELFSAIEHNVTKVQYEHEGGSVSTDFYKTDRHYQSKEYDKIPNILTDEIKLFIRENNLKYNKNHTSWRMKSCPWFEKGKLEDYHSVHNHGACGYSAVCFINYDPNVHKPTKFQSPFLDFNMGDIIHYLPPNIEEGSMIIFPSAIAHSTIPSHVNVNRLILSFNLEVK